MELGWSFYNLVLHNARNNQAFVDIFLHRSTYIVYILASFENFQINETYEMQEATFSCKNQCQIAPKMMSHTYTDIRFLSCR